MSESEEEKSRQRADIAGGTTASEETTQKEEKPQKKDPWNKFPWKRHGGPEMRIEYLEEEKKAVTRD